MVTEDFVVSGTCSEQMYGMCESLWEPDMVREEQVCIDLSDLDLVASYICRSLLCSLETRGLI